MEQLRKFTHGIKKTRHEIIKASKLCAAYEFIKSMPKNFNTYVGKML